jgi:hypothetical protein
VHREAALAATSGEELAAPRILAQEQQLLRADLHERVVLGVDHGAVVLGPTKLGDDDVPENKLIQRKADR